MIGVKDPRLFVSRSQDMHRVSMPTCRRNRLRYECPSVQTSALPGRRAPSKLGNLSHAFVKISDRQYLELFPEKEANSDRLNHILIEVDDAAAMRADLGSKGIKVPGEDRKRPPQKLEFKR